MLAALPNTRFTRGIRLLMAAPLFLPFLHGNAAAAKEILTSDNAEFTSSGRIFFFAVPDSAQHRFSCDNAPRLTRVHNEFVIRIQVVAEPVDPMFACHSLVDFGRLDAGTYTITASYAGAVTQTKRFTFTIDETAKIVRAQPATPAG
jgi:hypothetical protein